MSVVSTDQIIPRNAARVSISDALISGGTLSSCVYSGGSLSAGTLTGYVIDISSITAPQVSSGTVSGCVFSAGTVSGSAITSGTVSGCSITSPIVSGGTFTDFSAQMLLTSGSFTATGLTVDAAGTQPADLVGTYRIGSIDPFIMIAFGNGMGAYGNSAPLTVTLDTPGGVLPVALRPAAAFRGPLRIQHGATSEFGMFKIDTNGAIAIYENAAEDVFTATEAVVINQACFMYPIA